VSPYAQVAGYITGLALLAHRILTHGYDGLCLTFTFALIGVTVAPFLIAAIDEGTNLARLTDPKPLPHEDRE
jgi:hypothetical protein